MSFYLPCCSSVGCLSQPNAKMHVGWMGVQFVFFGLEICVSFACSFGGLGLVVPAGCASWSFARMGTVSDF